MIQLEFHGAASTVTGSNYLVKTPAGNFVVDCGMFQGPDVEALNLEPYDYNPSEVDFVLLTHAHIDHCGMLPKLYKNGFRGKIYATSHTIQISDLLLMDSAKIQENNFQRGVKYGKYTDQVALVYHSKDAEDTVGLFSAVNINEEFSPKEGITVKFIKAGHILGAASIEVTVEADGEKKMILFTGDIGRVNHKLIDTFDPEYTSQPDYILMESLYGGIEHPDRSESVNDLIQIINETIEKGGNVFIPSFAVQRTQELLHDMKIAKAEGKLPKDLNVWLDSPLAQRVSRIYTAALQHDPESLFDFPNLSYVKKYRQSQKLTSMTRQVIIAGSGMADGGRIMEHLATGLERQKNAVVFVGYQAEGTLGRELVDGAKNVTIGGTSVQVRAKIQYLHGFSAHGDNSDYMHYVKRHISSKLKKVFLIHSEEERAEALRRNLVDLGITKTHIPVWKEKVTLE